MADFDYNQMAQQMQQWAARMASQQGQGGSGVAPVLLGIRLEQNVGSGLSPQGKGFNSDGMLNKLPQGRPRLFASLCKQLGFEGAQIVADIGKCAQGAGAMYAGNVSNGSPVISNAPASSSGSGDIQMV